MIYLSSGPLTLSTFLLAFLLRLCHYLLPRMKLQKKLMYIFLSQRKIDSQFICVRMFYVYLVVVDEVHQDLHDTGEDHQTGAGNEEGVDVVK